MMRPKSILVAVVVTSLVVTFESVSAPQESSEGESGVIVLAGKVWSLNGSANLWEVPWRYHAGDDSAYARPDFDDTSWEFVRTLLRVGELPRAGWQGVGWFRLHVIVDTTFPFASIGITGGTQGKVGVYWDGRFVSDTLYFRFPTEIQTLHGSHVLAVRYERSDGVAVPDGEPPGFFVAMGEYKGTISGLLRQKAEQMFFTALLFAFGLLHLILFVFSPSLRANLYYSAFLIVMSITVYVDVQQAYLTEYYRTSEILLRIHRAVVPLTSILFLRFLYSIFYERCPRQFWFFVALMVGVGIVIVKLPQTHYHYYVWASTLATIEMIRTLIVAAVRKKAGAWIFGVGFFIVGLFSAYDALLDLEVMRPIGNVTNAYYFGFLGMMVAMSVYLARDYAHTAKKLLEQMKRTQEEETARRLVEADNKRKTQELEEARQLQLSLLPSCSNDIPGYDLCFHIKTATEVGGDYYDYHTADDGSLTIAVGDATGHGMKAGTMVSIIKGLFVTHAPIMDLPEFFNKCSQAIKGMKLGNLFMGLTLGMICDRKLILSSAGMPPVLVFRRGTHSVEEIVIKSMPLGGPGSQAYETKTVVLDSGDILLFMSDGLAELFNPTGEILDYPRIKELFAETADRSASEIAAYLEKKGFEWAAGKPQGDDITLVVVKVTGRVRKAET